MGKFEVESAMKALVSEAKSILLKLRGSPLSGSRDISEEVTDWIDGYADLVDELACTTSPVEIIEKLGELADLHQEIKAAVRLGDSGKSPPPHLAVVSASTAA